LNSSNVANNTEIKARDRLVLFSTLLIFWLILNGTLALDSLVIGIFVSLAISLLFGRGLSFFTEFRLTPDAFVAGLKYFAYFFKALVIANIRLAKIVLSPSLPINPGIIKVRTRLKSKMGRLMLANSITLTPGTLTVEIKDEWLYIHCVTIESTDIEQATAQISAGFESYLEVIYG
jgi:multicomponent Na+:H+ antiporter subunit E